MRLTLEEALERDGRTPHEIAQAALFGDENAPTLCDHGCEVEPGRNLPPRLSHAPPRSRFDLNCEIERGMPISLDPSFNPPKITI